MLNVVEKITNHVGSKNGSQMMNDETEDEK